MNNLIIPKKIKQNGLIRNVFNWKEIPYYHSELNHEFNQEDFKGNAILNIEMMRIDKLITLNEFPLLQDLGVIKEKQIFLLISNIKLMTTPERTSHQNIKFEFVIDMDYPYGCFAKYKDYKMVNLPFEKYKIHYFSI